MSYRLLRITNFYTEYINHYYIKFPNIKELSYDEQYNHLINDSIEMVSSYTKHLIKSGIDALDIVTNAEQLQQTWAKEHTISPDTSFKELITEQIKFYKPDVLWLDDSRLFNKTWIKHIKSEIPSIKLIAGHICAPYNTEISNSFSSFDIIFTCIPCMQEEIEKYGVATQLLYHSFDHSILDTINSEENNAPETNLIFTGSLYTGYGFHKTRIEYIEKMIENGIDLKIYGNLESRSKVLLKQTMYYSINFLKNINCDFLVDTLPVLKNYRNYGGEKITYYSKKLIESVNPPIFGLDMFRVLSKAKICFNIHGDIAKKCAGNVRLFEVTGVGSCLVTDWKENLSNLFDVDNEIVTYKSLNECIEKIKWLTNNPVEAKKIALSGQKRTLKDHTIENRISIIDSVLRSKL